MLKFDLLSLLFLISALGPNIGFGFRLEHFVIYLLFITIIFLLPILYQTRVINIKILKLSLPLLFSGIIVILSDFYLDPQLREGNLYSGIDNILQPFILAFALSVSTFNKFSFLKLLRLIVILGSIVSVINILSVFIDLHFFFKYFISDIDDENGLWQQVLSLGRYTGIFSQPLEAGIFFSVVLMSLIQHQKIKPISKSKYTLLIMLIILAGCLSLSKNFYLLGLILSFILNSILNEWTLRKFILVILVTVILITLLSSFIFFFLGNYMQSLIEIYQTDGLFAAITAGRFGGTDQTNVEMLFAELYNKSLFFGFGIGTKLPLDNGYLEFAYQGGILSILFYVVFLFTVVIKSIQNWGRSTASLVFVLGLFIILSGFGGPVITANRTNVFLIVLLIGSIIEMENKVYVK